MLYGYAGWHLETNLIGFGFPQLWLLVKCRVTNTSEPPVTITKWKVEVSKDPNSPWWSEPSLLSLPAGLQVRPRAEDKLVEAEEIADIDLREYTADPGLPYGPHKEGFLFVKDYGINHLCWLMLYTVRITAYDSQGGESCAVFPPGEWLREAEFSVEVDPPKLTAPLG